MLLTFLNIHKHKDVLCFCVNTHTHSLTDSLITVTQCVIALIVQTCWTLTAWWVLGPQSYKRTITQPLKSKLSSSANTLRYVAHQTAGAFCSVLNDPGELCCLIIEHYVWHYMSQTSSILSSTCFLMILNIRWGWVWAHSVGTEQVSIMNCDVEHRAASD